MLKILLAKQNLNLVLSTLTDREKQLLSLLVAGRTNRQIGEELHLSERTVCRILSRLYQRLGAKNRAEATFIVGQTQYLTPLPPPSNSTAGLASVPFFSRQSLISNRHCWVRLCIMGSRARP
ncbi:MAG: helix-turn-helix transcriptional regulator [Chloroflexi bacterium]|nr:helix-turn-helix transcriptional regulator [Ardenticatenaceae bacterium]MBL1129063.1 LuxR family transcriptional regulator [Chloroflexota bacterium]NOG35142.1 helix-turn-helix transcriptional regulator [Chloroflexota bacterium]